MMQSIVIDSSVAINWYVGEIYSDIADQLLEDQQQQRVQFLAPDLIYAEVGNIAWKKVVHTKTMSGSDAAALIAAFHQQQFIITPTATLLKAAYRIAIDHGRSAACARS